MTNWKDTIYHPQEPAQPLPAREWFTESELDFISTEIIEKLIEDIPDRGECCGCNLEYIKQDLRKEWL